MLAKVLQIAAKLDAIVEDDEGEVYTSPDEVQEELPNKPEAAGRETSLPEYLRKEKRWNWIIAIIIAITIIAIKVLDLW